MEKKNNVIRIAIVGPESTGKSTLCEYLAKEFNTTWVPEYAREFLSGKTNLYSKEDVLFIAKEQMRMEDMMAETANRYLFCDTNLLVIKVWMLVVFGEVDPWVEHEMRKRIYEVHLLCDIDHPWIDDLLREHPDRRDEIQTLYLNELKETKTNFHIVTGLNAERFSNAKKFVKETLLRHS